MFQVSLECPVLEHFYLFFGAKMFHHRMFQNMPNCSKQDARQDAMPNARKVKARTADYVTQKRESRS